MPKVDLTQIPAKSGSGYPGKLSETMQGRSTQRIGASSGLTQFGANLIHLVPGAMSSLRHYHMEQDEFVMVTAGQCTLIDDHGETQLSVGECASFPASDANGHHIVNKSDKDASFLVIGTHTERETAYYSDLDMKVEVAGQTSSFTKKDGSPLPADLTGTDTP